MKDRSKTLILMSKYGTFGFSVVAGALLGLSACGGSGHGGTIVNGQTPPVTNQVDRMGRPAIATTLVTGARKDEFNHVTNPATQDPGFRADAIAILSAAPYNNAANASSLATTLFPDILTVDTSKPTNYLNGRSLQDDVIDASLNLLTNGAVTTDNVGPKVYLSTFPFVGPPLQPQ